MSVDKAMQGLIRYEHLELVPHLQVRHWRQLCKTYAVLQPWQVSKSTLQNIDKAEKLQHLGCIAKVLN